MLFRAFVGDLHGSLKALNSVLEKVDLNTTELYFLGDYVDRGKDSFKVLSKCMELDLLDNVHFIKGNHDAMLVDYATNGDALHLANNYDLNTLKSFYPHVKMSYQGYGGAILGNDYEDISYTLRERLLSDDRIKWLDNLPVFLETENQIIVHAGVDKTLDNWKETSLEDMMWIRPNTEQENNTGKTVIVGHTITTKLQGLSLNDVTEQPNIFQSKHNEYYIDCANYLFDNANVLLYDVENNTYKQI